MDVFLPILMFFLGLVIGVIVIWFVFRSKYQMGYDKGKSESEAQMATLNERLSSKDSSINELKKQYDQLEREIRAREQQMDVLQNEKSNLLIKEKELTVKLEEEEKVHKEKIETFKEEQKRLTEQITNTFARLSKEALEGNNKLFLELAKENLSKLQESAKGDLDKRKQSFEELVKPIRDTLDKFDKKVNEIENKRGEAYSALNKQIELLNESQEKLRKETSNLVTAMRSPVVRGRWGEIQLKRVVEMAGMVQYCDFSQQESVQTEDGRLRPDMIIRLPSKKYIVVDSKAPLQAYLESLEITDEALRKEKLKEHAMQIRVHINKLSEKQYWSQVSQSLNCTPDFVVLFLPGETFFSAALEQDPSLIEMGVDKKIILSTPTTLIALLRAVAYGWQQENIEENAQNISQLGKELYERLCVLSGHFDSMGKGLNKAIEHYNNVVGSFNSRVFVTAKKFNDLGIASTKDIKEIQPVDRSAQYIQSNQDFIPHLEHKEEEKD